MKRPPPFRVVFIFSLKLYCVGGALGFLALTLALRSGWQLPPYLTALLP